MEENKFDILEEVEQDIVVNNEELKRELKEYEKLLLEEANRKTVEKSLRVSNEIGAYSVPSKIWASLVLLITYNEFSTASATAGKEST